jgi:hypothetical protein
MQRAPVGIYEPHIDYCEIRYDVKQLHPFAPGVFAVPVTDCTCWVLRKQIYEKFPPVDVANNRFGWGIPAVAAALAAQGGWHVLRDYGTSVIHPRGRGYPTEEARSQRQAYFVSLTPEIRRAAEQRMMAMSK